MMQARITRNASVFARQGCRIFASLGEASASLQNDALFAGCASFRIMKKCRCIKAHHCASLRIIFRGQQRIIIFPPHRGGNNDAAPLVMQGCDPSFLP
jgi:hypothetical protein